MVKVAAFGVKLKNSILFYSSPLAALVDAYNVPLYQGNGLHHLSHKLVAPLLQLIHPPLRLLHPPHVFPHLPLGLLHYRVKFHGDLGESL